MDNYVCLDELSINLIAYTSINPRLSELVTNLSNASNSGSKEKSSSWLEEYYNGADQEIYSVTVGNTFKGKTFSEMAAKIFHHYQIAIIAVRRPGNSNDCTFAVNPGNDWIFEPGDNIFVVANDFKKAEKVASCKKELTLPEIGSTDSEHGWKGAPIPKKNSVLDKVTFKGHILICGSIHNIAKLIEPLRSPDLKSFKKIVILHYNLPSEKEWENLTGYNEIYFVQGSPLISYDLIRAGAQYAEKAIILSNPNNMNKKEEALVDAATIMSVMGIETLESDVYSIAELVYSNNTKFIKPDKIDNFGENRRFTANEVITISKIADSLISQAYYTSNLLDIFDELFSVDNNPGGKARNTCEIYQIRVPDYFKTKTYYDLFQFLIQKYNILPIGLYRESQKKVYYVFTNPPASTMLKTNDSVYVLAADEPEL